jgi:hypothetical protein
MGKKKASRGRKLRHIIAAAIDAGKVYIRQKPSDSVGVHGGDIFEVSIGKDTSPWDSKMQAQDGIHLNVYIGKKNRVRVEFIYGRYFGLSRTDMAWLTDQLTNCIVMSKMGGHQSEQLANRYDEVDTERALYINTRVMKMLCPARKE